MKQQKSTKHRTLLIIVAIALIILAIILLYSRGTSVGQSIHLGQLPIETRADLAREDIVTMPLVDHRSINLTIPLAADDPAPQSYTLNITRRDANSFNLTVFQINKGQVHSFQRLYNDVLFTSLENQPVIFYVDQGDPIADLRIDFTNGEFAISSPHFISPDLSTIQLLDQNDQPLPVVINAAGPIQFKAHATSSASPRLNATGIGADFPVASLVQTTELQRDELQHASNVEFTFTPPANQNAAFVIDINATVGLQETHVFYTFTVGNVLYALNQPSTPIIKITKVPIILGVVNVTFPVTTQLQPFSPPCLPQDKSVAKVFSIESADHNPLQTQSATNIQRTMSYNTLTGDLEIYNRGNLIPDDFTTFTPFKGYFIKLASEHNTNISYSCTLATFEPVLNPPRPNDLIPTYTLQAGWNLISMPGLVPQSLTAFLPRGEFTLYDCVQNEVCHQVPSTTALLPGKTYWVNTLQAQTFRYQIIPMGALQ